MTPPDLPAFPPGVPIPHHATHEPGGSDPIDLTQVCGYGTLAARPGAAGRAGATYYATDVSGGTEYRSNGVTWDVIGPAVNHAARHALGGADRIYPSDLGEYLDRRRTSEVSTMSRVFVTASITPASGAVTAGLAYARTAGTFTKIRFATGATAPAGLTDFRAGAWAADGVTKLTETANEVATVTVGSTMYTLNLLAALTLAEGDAVYLGAGQIGTTPGSLRGLALSPAGMTSLAPALGRATTGWGTGTALPNLTTASANVLWLELLP